MIQDLLETWDIQQRINIYLFEAIPAAHLEYKFEGKGRSVGEQFMHLHNVRLMWLKVSKPELMSTVEKLEKENNPSPEQIADALNQSAKAMRILLEEAFQTGRVKNFKPHPAAFLGYMIAHESHHRAQILLVLKHHKALPDKKILYGMWEWGTR